MKIPIFFSLLMIVLAIPMAGFSESDEVDLYPDLAPAPSDMPAEKVVDQYTTHPISEAYEARRMAYIDFTLSNPPAGPYSELIRLSQGYPIKEQEFIHAMEKMAKREDCADFQLQALVRLLYQFGDSPLASDALKGYVKEAILNFKYWPDEPGTDDMCTWSENHYILFASAGYLTGQLFPEEIFVNSGRTGKEQMERFRPRIIKWMELRFKTGFNEWLSNVYYNEDFPALLNLVDFCEDKEIANRAAMICDLLLVDMASNSFKGLFGSTHGRTYEEEKKWAEKEHIRSVTKLMFGTSVFRPGGMSASMLAVSPKYHAPQVVFEMANDLDRKVLNKQRMGFRIEDSHLWDISPDNMEDGQLFMAIGAYNHPLFISTMMNMFDEYRWWESKFFVGYKRDKARLDQLREHEILPGYAWKFRHDLGRTYREVADIYTYRTPDYMLSSAQDYRSGMGGDQHHIWQASLGPNAVCFTTHPVESKEKSPAYWTGSGNLPRVAQIENVAIALYKVSTKEGPYITHDLEFTHAWLPKDQFDEVVEKGHWIFARKGDAYLGLWTLGEYHWQGSEGEDRDREVIVPGKENVYICELGSKADNGSFKAFCKNLRSATLLADKDDVVFFSPSQGVLEFGWRGSLRQNGQAVSIGNHPRYDSPYARVPYNATHMEFECNGEWLKLDWDKGKRKASKLMKP